MADTRIDILITATNQATAIIDKVVAGLSQVKGTLGQVNTAGKQDEVSPALNKQTAAAKPAADAVDHLADAHKKSGAAAHGHSGLTVVLGEAFLALNHRLGSLVFGFEAAASAFAAFHTVQEALEVVKEADRVAVLGEALVVLGRNAGVPKKNIDETSEALEKLGFDAEQARQLLTKLVQINVDTSFAEPLARAAQDLSIINGNTAAQTLEDLTSAVETGRTLMLRRMGIVVNQQKVLQDAEAAYGVTLTDTAKKQVLLSAVLEEAGRATGLYAANMDSLTVQQQLLAVTFNDTEEALGRRLRPTVVAIISVIRQVLDVYKDLRGESEKLTDTQKRLGITQEQLNQSGSILAKIIHTIGDALAGSLKFILDHQTAIKAIVGTYLLWVGIPALVGGVTSSLVFLAAKAIAAGEALLALNLVIRGIALAEAERGIISIAAGIGQFGGAAAAAAPKLGILARLFSTGIGQAALGLVGSLAGLSVAFGTAVAAALTVLAPFLAIAGVLALVGIAAYAAYDKIYGPKNRAAEAAKAFDVVKKAIEDQTEALDALGEKSKEVARARTELAVAGQGGDEAAIEAAKTHVEELSKQENALRKTALAANEKVQKDKEAFAATKGITEQQTADIERLTQAQTQSEKARERARADSLATALKGLGIEDGTELKTGIDPKLQTQVSSLSEAFKAISEDSKKSGEDVGQSFDVLVDKAAEVAKKIKTSGELVLFQDKTADIIESLKERGRTDLIPTLQSIAAEAALAVRKELAFNAAGGQQAFARQGQVVDLNSQEKVVAAQEASKNAAAQAELAQKKLDDSFQQGLVSIETYYARKRQLEDQDFEQQRIVLAAEIAQQRANLAQRQPTLSNEDVRAESQKIQEKELQYNEINRKQNIAIADAQLKRTESLRQLNIERQKLAATALETLGDAQGGQQQQILIDYTEKRRQLISQIADLESKGQTDAANAARTQLDNETAIAGIKTRNLEIDREQLRLNIAKADATLQETLSNAQLQTYQITRAQNEKDITDLTQKRLDLASQELALIKERIDQQPLSLELRDQEKQKITEIITLQQQQLTQFRETADAINTSLHSGVENFLDLVVNQGKRIGDSLKQTLASFLTDVNKSLFKKAADSAADSLGDLGGFVTGTASKGNDSGIGSFLNSIRAALGQTVGKDKEIKVPPATRLSPEVEAAIKQQALSGELGATPGTAIYTKSADLVATSNGGVAPAGTGALPAVAPVATNSAGSAITVPGGDKDPGNDQLTKNELAAILAQNGLNKDQQALGLAIYQRESGSGTNPAALTPGVNGAVGGLQFIPKTFDKLLPNGDINEPEDQAKALALLIKQLQATPKIGNDNAKTAAAYLGGPSAIDDETKLIKVKYDGLGTSTTKYAQQVADNADKIKASASATSTDTDATTQATTATKNLTQSIADADAQIAKNTAGLQGAPAQSIAQGIPPAEQQVSVASVAAQSTAQSTAQPTTFNGSIFSKGNDPANPLFVSDIQGKARAATSDPAAQESVDATPERLAQVRAQGQATDFSSPFDKLLSGLAPVLGAVLGGKLGGTTGSAIGGTLGALAPTLLKLGTALLKLGTPLFNGKKAAPTGSGDVAGFAAQDAAALNGEQPAAAAASKAEDSVGSFFDRASSAFSKGIDSLSGLFSKGSTLSTFFTGFSGAIAGFFSALSGSGGGGAGDAGSYGQAAAAVGSLVAKNYDSIVDAFLHFTGYAEGGPVSGAGTGTSDSIPAWLSHGEYVMTADKTAQFYPLLEMMRAGTFDLGRLISGRMSSFSVPSMAMATPRSNRFAGGGVVNAADPQGPGHGKGSGSPIVNINISTDGNTKTSTSGSADDSLKKFGESMANVARAEIAKQQQPGGLLNPAN